MSDSKTKKVQLCLRVQPKTSQYLRKLCKQQTGHVSLSTMAELVFEAAQRLGIYQRGSKEREK